MNIDWLSVLWGAAVTTIFWTNLEPYIVRWRTKRRIDDYEIWVETEDDRGRKYPAEFTMYRVLYPESRARGRRFALPCIVPLALERYIKEKAS